MFMRKGMSIGKIFKSEKKLFSVEFFPPKNDEGGKRMLETASVIQPLNQISFP